MVAKGVAGGQHVFINRPDDKRARDNKKKVEIIKSTGVRKVAKRGNNIKIAGENSKREQEDRTRNTTLSHNNPKPEARKKQTETAANCAERGTLAAKICHIKTVQIGINKTVSKKIKQTHNTAKKSKPKYMYIPLKMRGTSKQSKQATVLYDNNNMCILL